VPLFVVSPWLPLEKTGRGAHTAFWSFVVFGVAYVLCHHPKSSIFTRHHTQLIPYAFPPEPWDSPTPTSPSIERHGRAKQKRRSNNAGEASPKIETRREKKIDLKGKEKRK